MSYATEQRCDRILAEVLERRHVTVKDLARQMQVSQATIRRDLRSLADQGQIEIVHGGARLLRNADYSFRSKAMRNVEAKRAIGRLAAELVGDSDQVFIDSGTTCYELACRLKQKRGLSVVVNSARLAMELDGPGLNVILVGGQYRPDRMDTIGPLARNALEQLRGYVAFIGADGLSREFGLTASDIESAHLYRLAAANARESVLLVDHSKFESPSLFKIVEWEAISRVVTDRRPDEQWTEFFASKAIEVISGGAGGEADGGGAAAGGGRATAESQPAGRDQES